MLQIIVSRLLVLSLWLAASNLGILIAVCGDVAVVKADDSGEKELNSFRSPNVIDLLNLSLGQKLDPKSSDFLSFGTIGAPVDVELELTESERKELVSLHKSLTRISVKAGSEIRSPEVLEAISKMPSKQSEKERRILNSKVERKTNAEVAKSLCEILDPVQRDRLNQLARQRIISTSRNLGYASDHLVPSSIQFLQRDCNRFEAIEKEYSESVKPANFNKIFSPYLRGETNDFPKGIEEWRRRALSSEGQNESLCLQLEILSHEQLRDLRLALGKAFFLPKIFDERLDALTAIRLEEAKKPSR